MANILNPALDQSSESVQFQMKCLLNWVEQTYTGETDQPMVKNLTSYTKGFWKGLFTCYDHPHVPRTNNDHERFFRKTKTRHRRMTGLRSWNEYINRSGEFVVFVDDALCQKNLLKRLQGVSYQAFREERIRWTSRLEETTRRRRFRRNPQKYLQEAETKFCTLIGQL
ncbi:IS66 family transposase [Paenibacillus thermotolerans]|uniref:IS66 family transposase n=1 Tax=Paenibacillus thermotolerans TaxID=3027807 RepID=UPI003CC6D428